MGRKPKGQYLTDVDTAVTSIARVALETRATQRRRGDREEQLVDDVMLFVKWDGLPPLLCVGDCGVK